MKKISELKAVDKDLKQHLEFERLIAEIAARLANVQPAISLRKIRPSCSDKLSVLVNRRNQKREKDRYIEME